ncbi:18357_t:CDS:2, partial [Racocetra fulgida]
QILDYDEISAFIDFHYVSAPKAYWRLSEYKMQNKSHSIICLPVHLPDEHNIYFSLRSEVQALNSLSSQNTMLTAWFKLNEYNIDARQISKKRVKHIEKIITLMRELLNNDNKWNRYMNEAIQWQMPRKLRQLFATILIWSNISNPLLLWNQYKIYLYEDLLHNHSTEVSLFLAYQDINKKLAQFKKSLKTDFHIPIPIATDTFNNEKQIDRDQEYRASKRMYAQLNNAQWLIADKVIAAWLIHLENRTLLLVDDEIEVLAQCISTNNLVTDIFGNALENEDEAILLSTVILYPTNKISLE